jgi:hypothetical protein
MKVQTIGIDLGKPGNKYLRQLLVHGARSVKTHIIEKGIPWESG